ncbi:TetR/AcrR family transcriptional regulator [Mycobacteroides abscessus]|uniref:TetR/AcrR family transcriptional regulator n=1 Tax=Mycobacteroides abscessus TaxID=36809 RepID=UPI000927BB7C|nr:TetR/AcrR family transcriptional regulator [Mycobacteroides abscessus]UEA48432.1 TetR/AcrR family transcriptional regulator [Mycobacteroides abscessus subsp. abscessus]UEA51587.1 TetR/AcrR family transcriptional regulator [Mycobacteroides abscessus]SIH92395.1 TetR family transcriptional regulator [Mycobacteroides abscessus subsp. bolletii]SLE08755.1 TetR family transcriptional regulator [Mycobacteroides abscessus subsp. bolletii]SLE93418.1 TetR family transcriptional regulator [Mycobacteroi
MVKATQRQTARDRVLEASLALFVEHGVSGTSLQMIADRMGTSKSAVLSQFGSKEDIVIATVTPVFDDIARVVKIAESMTAPEAQREVIATGLVELTVRHRYRAVLYFDPAVDSAMRRDPELHGLYDKLVTILSGPDGDLAATVAAVMLVCGLFCGIADPRLSDAPEGELHRIMLANAKRHLQL